MRRLSLQARLTAWYFLSLAAVVGLFAGGSWLAMKASMVRAIDRDLQYRIASVIPFIESHALHTRPQFADALTGSSDSSVVGLLVQITDDHSQILYQSDVLAAHRIGALPAAPSGGSPLIASAGSHGWPIRVISQRILINGLGLNVHVIEPLRDLVTSLHQYQLYLGLLIPLVLLVSSTAGYWMSRRALAPVEQIRREADAIDPSDLAARLQVPPTEDELARLAQTLNAMLARIEASFRSVQQFTADASHELRAPLALVTTAAEVSLRRERSRDELAEVLSKILREARHMGSLIDNLLDLARGDALHPSSQTATVEIVGLLQDLCAELTPAVAAKGLRLAVDLPGAEVPIPGDATELRRLFLILLDNAIKYTETGSIRLSVTGEAGKISVAVSDTGIGIEESAVGHVFDRFWRADKVRSRAEGGAGLGLALAAQIVQRHNGTIAMTSRPGEGSSFTVRLPAARN